VERSMDWRDMDERDRCITEDTTRGREKTLGQLPHWFEGKSETARR